MAGEEKCSDVTPARLETTESRRWIMAALVTDIVIVVGVWALRKLGTSGDGAMRAINLGEVPIFGVAMMLIPIVTFAGFYLSTPPTASSRDPWMRNSIAATFVLSYLFLVALLLGLPSLRSSVSDPTPGRSDTTQALEAREPFGEVIFKGFSTFLGVVLAFYFAAQAVERVTETVQSGLTTRAAINTEPTLAQQVITEQRSAVRQGGPPF